MSLGGPYNQAASDAVRNVVQTGLTVVAAAGNSAANASQTTPASEPSVITVGATDENDTFAWFSNYGTSLDILAPGTNIVSAWGSSNTATMTLSGTSMGGLFFQSHNL